MENILIEKQDNIAVITINRPTKLNALNKQTIQELHDGFKTLSEDKSVKAIIIIGTGEKAFVAGADISEFENFSVEEGEKLAAEGQALLFDFVQNLDTPVIAAVNGFALGGGLELAMSCHFRVASDNAKMGLPEVTLGVIPGYGGTQRLAQLVGKGRAMEMIMTAGMIDAETAKNYGLVNHVVPADQLMTKAEEILNKIKNKAPMAIASVIRCVNAYYEKRADGNNVEINEFGNFFGSEDFIEGTRAFLEKRPAKFAGN